MFHRFVIPYNPVLLLLFECHINVEIVCDINLIKYLFKYIFKGGDRAIFGVRAIKDVMHEPGSEFANRPLNDVVVGRIRNNINNNARSNENAGINNNNNNNSNQNNENVIERKEETIDEIKRYQDSKYTTAHEAFFNICEFDLTSISPGVEVLPIHLPAEQFVTFSDSLEDTAILDALKVGETTKLTAYFDLCANEDDWKLNYNPKQLNYNGKWAHELRYDEIPESYSWTGKKWKRRDSKSDRLGRMHTASPTHGDRYYLRLLLSKRKGVKSFEALKTVDDEICETFREACDRLGLLQNDGEWHGFMTEISEKEAAPTIRRSFVSILIFGEVSNPQALWEAFRMQLSEDIIYERNLKRKQQRLEPLEAENLLHLDIFNRIFNECLLKIELILNETNRTCASVGLTAPSYDIDDNKDDIENVPRQIRAAMDFKQDEMTRLFEEHYEQLNDKQRTFFNVIKDKIDNNEGGVFFLNAPGGTGKTFVCNVIIEYLNSLGKFAVATALSGIAALNLYKGATIHSTFKIPQNVTSESTSSIGLNGTEGDVQLLQECAAMFMDEASMTHIDIFNVINKALQYVQNVERLFGSKLVILTGDWQQILPVVKAGGRGRTVAATFRKSMFWKECEYYELDVNQRVKNCEEAGNQELAAKLQQWAEYLKKVGSGTERTYDELGCGSDLIKLPENIISTSENLHEFADEIYPNFVQNCKNQEYLLNRVIITSRNKDVDEINDKMLEKMVETGVEIKEYEAADMVVNSEHAQYLQNDMLTSKPPSGFPPTILKLCVGCPLIITRNIDPKNGGCNGTRCILLAMHRWHLEVMIAIGTFKGNVLRIPRIDFITDPLDSVIQWRRRQFPVKPAFAMTIHKSQGQTLQYCGLYLPQPLFTHGQLYVALSRVGNPDNIKVFVRNSKCQGKLVENSDDVYTRNVVFREFFEDEM